MIVLFLCYGCLVPFMLDFFFSVLYWCIEFTFISYWSWRISISGHGAMELPNYSWSCSINILTCDKSKVEGILLSPYTRELQSCTKPSGDNLIFTWYLMSIKKAQWCMFINCVPGKQDFFPPSFATFFGSFRLSGSIWFWRPGH